MQQVDRQCEVILKGRRFFLYNQVLFCEELFKGLKVFKIVIPDLLALDLVIQSHRHYGCIRGKKLINQLSSVFEIRNVAEICSRVVAECFSCSLTAKAPCGRFRQNLPKDPVLLNKKMTIWAIDELQIVSETTGEAVGFHKVLCAVDLFSHFMVCGIVVGNLDGEQLLNFIQSRIISVFGWPSVIVTDNAKNMHNKLVQDVCSYMHINKTTIAPYSSRSNLAELLNRMLLDCMRALTATNYMNPSVAITMLSPVVHLINSLTFRNQKFISPYFLQFAQKAKVEIISFYDGDLSAFENIDDYVKNMVQVSSAVTKIRLAMISGRKYTAENSKTQNYFNQIQVGSLVSVMNPELIVKKKDFKLRPKFKNRFLVAKRTSSAVFLVPCTEIYLKDFFRKKQGLEEPELATYYKADISSVKLLTNTLILNSNKTAKFYSNFFDKHSVPPSFFLNQDESGARVRQLHDFDNEGVVEELENTVQLVQKLKLQSGEKLKSAISTQRARDIKSISRLFGGKPEKLSVSFDSKVVAFKLICPEKIFFALSPKSIPLKDVFEPPIRKLAGEIFCYCARCRLLIGNCQQEACAECFGKHARGRSVLDEGVVDKVSVGLEVL